MYRKRNTNYQKILLEQERRVFRTADLSVLWGVDNKNSLLTTIKRYVKAKILYRIYKGLYSVVAIEKLEAYELGCALAGPLSYVTTESVLQSEGVIMQNIDAVTLLGRKKAEYLMGGRRYICRFLNSKYLVNRTGIEDGKNFSVASLERAVIDMLHLNCRYYFDNQIAIDQKRIDILRKEVGY